jgi:hypothetical protein
MKMNQPYGASTRLLLLVLAAAATSTHAALPLFDSLIDQINTSSEMQTAADSSSSTEEFQGSYLHVVDSVLITVIAWLVVVNVSNLKSLFVDDMFHRNVTYLTFVFSPCHFV